LIAIDDGKVLFTTQTLGLNPEILESEQIIERLNDRFDIKAKKGYSFIFLRCRLCGTERMKLDLSQVQSYFTNAIVSEEDTYAAVMLLLPKGQKIFILGTGSNCSYFDGKELIRKYSH
jgi:hypothetical protein